MLNLMKALTIPLMGHYNHSLSLNARGIKKTAESLVNMLQFSFS